MKIYTILEQIIATFMQEDNFTDALAVANMMPQLYGYDNEALIKHNYYMDMLNLQINLAQQNRSIYELDSTEVINLVAIAENSKGIAGSQAKGILEFAYGYEYCNCLNLADTTGYKSSGKISPNDISEMYGFNVSAKPNPASEWIGFNFTLPYNQSEGIIKITDVSGKLITTLNITGNRGQKVWDTREIKQGIYFYTLMVDGISKTGKIVISK